MSGLGVTRGVGTDNQSSSAYEFTLGFSGVVRGPRSLVFCVMFC